jgi:hypothetical protein
MPADLDLVLPGAAPTGPFGPESLATPVPLPPPLPDPLVDTRHDLPPITDDLMAAGYDLGPEPRPGEPSAGGGPETSVIPAFGLMPDAPARPGGPAGFPAAARADGRRGRGSLIVAAAVAIVVAAGVTLGLTLTAGGTTAGTSNAPVVRPGTPTGTSASGASPDAAASASASASASRASASASAAAQASKQAAASAVAVSLPLASARAFGPAGFADGDDPGNAGDTIATGATQSWATQWYATADFGMLKHGTGLLIDLGRPSTVAGVRLGLSQYRGANLEIRLGNGTAPSDLKAVKAARNVGGVVRLALRHPAVGRYLLVWFTKLPPDGQGHYQETVSHVMVSGHR